MKEIPAINSNYKVFYYAGIRRFSTYSSNCDVLIYTDVYVPVCKFITGCEVALVSLGFLVIRERERELVIKT